MKVLVVTTPIRPQPVNFPPFGSLAIINYLRKNMPDVDVEFYHIDGLRPAYDQVLAHIQEIAPDVVGISAVVSTAYAYTKRLSLDIKRMFPDTMVVVGGNMAASAEILLRKAKVDFCVLGEGERIFANIVERARTCRQPAGYHDIRGIVYLSPDGQLVNTLFDDMLDKSEIYDIDWHDLERAGCLGLYVDPAFKGDKCVARGFARDARTYDPPRRGKTRSTIVASKGCVARCTFCHRWTKGIRYIPVPLIMERIRHLVEHHNLGFLEMGDENFGTDRRWLAEFCASIKELDILWRVSGMRSNCVSPEALDMMRDAGCTYVVYGIETGSARMLDVMEKKTGMEANRRAMEWTVERGLFSPMAIVLGMPGENEETIRETTEFIKYALTLTPDQNPNDLSINLAQALPGTPLYEYARQNGMIGTSLDDEEAYLLSISDRDAHDELTTLNFTNRPTLRYMTWRPRITIEVNYAFVRKYGLQTYLTHVLREAGYFRGRAEESGYFANPKRLLDAGSDIQGGDADAGILKAPPVLRQLLRREFGLAMICHPVLFYRLRHLVPWMLLAKDVARSGLRRGLGLIGEYLADLVGRSKRARLPEYKSLRKIVEDGGPVEGDGDAMIPLRRGR